MNATARESGVFAPKPDHEILSFSQRGGELVSIVFMLLAFSFFAYHQAAHTGFFTAAFGLPEMLFVYGPILLSVTAPIIRSVTGRRNPGRPAEIVTNLFSVVAAVWLLNVFPFDFAHLADALPSGIQFLLAWVNNDLGRIFLLLQAVVGLFVALVTTWQYLSHRLR